MIYKLVCKFFSQQFLAILTSCWLQFCILVSALLLLSCDSVEKLQRESPLPRHYVVAEPSSTAAFAAWLRQSGLTLQGWRWKLQYFGSSHWDDSLQLRSAVRKSAVGEKLNIELQKRQSLLLLAFPQFDQVPDNLSPYLWQPAGAAILWQNHSNDENNTVKSYPILATWLGGFHGKILGELLYGGFDIRYFNAAKLWFYLEQRIKQKTGDFIANPGDYDLRRIVAEISSLEMDWYDIKLRRSVEILTGPQGIRPGRWQALNVAEPALSCPCDPKTELAVGTHYFWELDTKKLWQFAVQTDGEVLALEL